MAISSRQIKTIRSTFRSRLIGQLPVHYTPTVMGYRGWKYHQAFRNNKKDVVYWI